LSALAYLSGASFTKRKKGFITLTTGGVVAAAERKPVSLGVNIINILCV